MVVAGGHVSLTDMLFVGSEVLVCDSCVHKLDSWA